MYNIHINEGVCHEYHYRNKGCPVKSKKDRGVSPAHGQDLLQSIPGRTRGVLKKITSRQETLELTRINKQLRKNEATLKSIFLASQVGIMFFTADNKISLMNDKMTSITGYRLEDIENGNPKILYPTDEEFTRVRELAGREIKGGNIGEIDTTWIRKDGKIRHIHISLAPIDPDDLTSGAVCTATDVTEQKEAEGRLLESEERFRTAVEHSNDGITLVRKGKIVYVNQRFLGIFGYNKPEEVIGESPIIVIHPDDYPMVRRYRAKREQGEMFPEEYEHRGIKKDGTMIFIEASVTETTYRGEPVAFIYQKDITARKDAEMALRASEERFRTLVEKSSEVIFLDDKNRKRTYVSPSIGRVLGYTVEEFFSMGRSGFIHPDDVGSAEIARSRILENPGEPVTFTNRVCHKDGSWRWVESTIRNLLNEPGVSSFVVNFHDITERKMAEEALLESENKFKDLADKSFVGVYIIQDKVFRYVNARFAEIHGYIIEEIVDKMTPEKMIFPEDLPSVDERVQVRETGAVKSLHHEFRVATKVGEIKYIEAYGTRTMYQGKPATIGAVIDITERKQAEEALRKSEEKYRNIFENAVEGIFQTTPEGQLLSANPALARIFGFDSPEELMVSRVLADAIYAIMEDHKALISLMETHSSAEGFELQLLRRDGKKIWVSINVRVVHDASRKTDYYEGTIADITNRKLTAEALAESEAKYRNVVDHLIVGFYIIQDKRFCFVNRRFCEMSGYSYEELVGNGISPLDLIHDVDKKLITKVTTKQITGEMGYIGSITYKGIRKDGQIMIVRGLSNLLIYNGRAAITGTVIDITREETLESQLRQTQKMEAVGTLAGGIAHDFNNILTAIIGYGRLLQMKMAETDPLRTYVMHMLSSSEKAANLTRNLLTFSRKQIIELKPVEVGKIVRGMERLLKSLLTEDIELKIISPDPDIIIMADISQMEQVLLNLASNANDAMPRGGTLTIETKEFEMRDTFVDGYDYIKSGQYARISVVDTGTGIDENARNKIFEPFFTTKEVGKGTGLGLSIVHGIVDQHHGHITVNSKLQGGTVFHIYLPEVKTVLEEAESTSPVAEGGTETVLIAEDDPQVRSLTTEILSSAGYTVIETIDGEEALKEFIEHSDEVALLLLDVVMPRKNGKEAYDAINKINPDVKVIFMSGYTGDVVISKGIIEREYDFIQKPLSPNELLHRVREVLARRY